MQPSNVWLIAGQQISLQARGLIMGIVNVTPDSFSDGGRHFATDDAIQQGLRLQAEGADILDIGGESTRPGAEPVSEQEELNRVIPVITALRQRSHCLISVDTFKPRVAAAALAAGAQIINDVSGFRSPEMVKVAAASNAGLVIMHMQGQPRTMQQQPEYADVVATVCSFLADRMKALQGAGVVPERIVLDPGIGFGKSLEHNLTLLKNLPALRLDGRPLLIGASRKSFIGKVLDTADMDQRHWPTVALTAWTRDQGAHIHRVHQVKANVESLRMMEAVLAQPQEA
jgi:dihydropteroate synthase